MCEFIESVFTVDFRITEIENVYGLLNYSHLFGNFPLNIYLAFPEAINNAWTVGEIFLTAGQMFSLFAHENVHMQVKLEVRVFFLCVFFCL